uniref:Uncharacterized protein n=1 Tax=uncultured bacterium TB306_p TaxID=1552137 RepID=A0A0K0LBI3_9BACT|nr:hypothetical protein [uncultured bacterium TB306_p]
MAEFPLTSVLMRKAARGEMDSQLEFYVTVEYYTHKKHATNNVNVKNPFPQQSTPRTTSPQTPAKPKAKSSPAAQKPPSKKEEAGILETISQKWDELWDWAESKGTGTKEKAQTVHKPSGKSATVVKEAKPETAKNCGRKILY